MYRIYNEIGQIVKHKGQLDVGDTVYVCSCPHKVIELKGTQVDLNFLTGLVYTL